jgi:hypothetical protein
MGICYEVKGKIPRVSLLRVLFVTLVQSLSIEIPCTRDGFEILETLSIKVNAFPKGLEQMALNKGIFLIPDYPDEIMPVREPQNHFVKGDFLGHRRSVVVDHVNHYTDRKGEVKGIFQLF